MLAVSVCFPDYRIERLSRPEQSHLAQRRRLAERADRATIPVSGEEKRAVISLRSYGWVFRSRGWGAMNRAVAIASIVGALVLLGGQALAQATNSLEGRLKAALEAVVASDETVFPGAILQVSQPDQGAYAVASGVADIATNLPLSPDARFRAGSILKPFVAVVVLQLVEEDKLSLDDAMTELLPEEVTGRFKDTDKITLRMLLDHTSGIPEWLSDEMIGRIAADPAKIWDVREFLDAAAAQPPAFAPGEGWGYSNTDYNLLGLVIERATGQSWRERRDDARDRAARAQEHDAARARRQRDRRRLHAWLRHDRRQGHGPHLHRPVDGGGRGRRRSGHDRRRSRDVPRGASFGQAVQGPENLRDDGRLRPRRRATAAGSAMDSASRNTHCPAASR